ncbi:AAA family ATPase [Botrimarina mediterranea]|uniref:ATP-dependent zinc metalloprotease FtsH 3 n=1 Tax=Botrimarina mediterranea TaxID=2528022 RepID=A0A518K778_9BACT|nr:ATP-binding protein [Botrimarina mediterranea]QDV73646.1 ATP-dependent zinc metalloprotease FtsH 3 [Botrimarina mediterranea]QDV78236.1 ATP-dependent zinc metalloprotease FtsH 3 [Planctomycetes bacterium K2D]
MATAAQIKSLLRSYGDADGEQFVSVALQIAAHSARKGDAKLAQEVRDLVDEIKRRQSEGRIGGAVPIAQQTGDLAGLLAVSYPKTRLAEMVLAETTAGQLRRVIHEYRHQDKLRSHGLSGRRKLLLVGPPGCGKTMTASALAGELKLPLLAVQLHGLITKFMGETAAKLHLVFQAMAQTRGVYLFDEFDAIGADRGGRNDVGEVRRILNSFLQFLEQDHSDSLVVAATNYVGMLDGALFRRFDDVVHYDHPTGTETVALIQNRLRAFLQKEPDWDLIRNAATGLSHAEIARACDDAAKTCIIDDQDAVTDERLVDLLVERRRTHPAAD